MNAVHVKKTQHSTHVQNITEDCCFPFLFCSFFCFYNLQLIWHSFLFSFTFSFICSIFFSCITTIYVLKIDAGAMLLFWPTSLNYYDKFMKYVVYLKSAAYELLKRNLTEMTCHLIYEFSYLDDSIKLSINKMTSFGFRCGGYIQIRDGISWYLATGSYIW